MTDFKISKDLSLPRESATWVFAFLAKRGAGKTYDAADLAEEMLKAQIPIVVIDGMGIWWGLRVGKTGEGPGLPVVVFGGEHGDLPLVPEKAKNIAHAIVEANISVVLDLSALSKRQSRLIVTDFLDELYRLNRLERHVFIEETDMYAPQKTIGPEMATCLGSVDNFVRRGGNHNLGCTMITQRSAVLNKDILTQSDCLVVLRTLAPQDKKAIQAWVEEQTDEDRRKLHQWYDSLKQLRNGEAWVWHPEKPTIYKRVMFRQRETFHATRAFLLSPKAATIKLMDVQEFVEKFRTVFEPKPKPPPQTASSRSELAKATVKVEQKVAQVRDESRTLISVPTRRDSRDLPDIGSDDVVVRQTLPNVILEKARPTITITSEPSSPLARVVAILANWQGRGDKRWTRSQIEAAVQQHEWPTDGVQEAVSELVRWEILTPVQSGARTDYIYSGRDRVRVVERAYQVEAS
jgi:hypothetical protein